MAMTPIQMMAFFTERAEYIESILELPSVRENSHLFCLNARQTCQNHLMAALVAWRHHLDDPVTHLSRSLAFGERAVPDVFDLDIPVPLHERIRLHDIAFCAVLTDTPLSNELAALLATAVSTADAETLLDLTLALRLTNDAQGLDAAVSNFPCSSKTQLVYQTYETYARIIAGDTAAVADAESNFSLRARNGYYTGGLQIDGGGPDNSHTIDYRLAAIIHSSRLSVTTIHQLPPNA